MISFQEIVIFGCLFIWSDSHFINYKQFVYVKEFLQRNAFERKTASRCVHVYHSLLLWLICVTGQFVPSTIRTLDYSGQTSVTSVSVLRHIEWSLSCLEFIWYHWCGTDQLLLFFFSPTSTEPVGVKIINLFVARGNGAPVV